MRDRPRTAGQAGRKIRAQGRQGSAVRRSAVLVLAVHHGGDRFEPNEYYDRLRDLMGYGGDAEIKSGPMGSATRAWEMLEEWSCRLQMGRPGMFEVRVLGGKRFIGVPLRQALLSPKDELALQQVFSNRGLEPHCKLTETAALDIARSASLRNRARKVLAEYPASRASRELVDDVIDVYDSWDGDGRESGQENRIRRPIRLRFQNKFPSLQGKSATATIGPDIRPRTGPSAAGIRLESTELRDNASELVRSDGTSIAEEIDWFAQECFEFELQDDRILQCYRSRRRCLWFANQGGETWVEQFEDELEFDRLYVEIRPACGITETPGAGSGGFLAPRWMDLESPAGLSARTFRFQSAVGARSDRRVSGRPHGGIRTQARGSIYYDFATPNLTWPQDGRDDSKIVLRAYDHRGGVLLETNLAPNSVAEVSSGFGEVPDATTTHIEVELQSTIDELTNRGESPALVEAFIHGSEDKSRVRIYLEHTTASVALAPPPRRSSIGAIDEAGPLSGRVGTRDSAGTDWFDDTQLGRPRSQHAPKPTSNSPHDRLCRLLRSRPHLAWVKARDQIRQCGRNDSFDDRHNLSSQLFSLHQMGVVEIVESASGGLERVQALPPRLAITVAQANLGIKPGGGLHKARRFLFTGAWLPRETISLYELASKTGGLMFHQEPDTVDTTLLPPDRCVLTTSREGESKLQDWAIRMGVQFESITPDAVSSLSSIMPISNIATKLEWRPGLPGAGYDTFEFDEGRVCRTSTRRKGLAMSLLECRHHDSGLWSHFLVDEPNNQHVKIHDRQLGRWLVRRFHLPDAPVPVDSTGALLVPLELRLPRHLERAFALESGRAPETVWFDGATAGSESPFLRPEIARRFRIPPPTARFCGIHRCTEHPSGPPVDRCRCWAAKRVRSRHLV